MDTVKTFFTLILGSLVSVVFTIFLILSIWASFSNAKDYFKEKKYKNAISSLLWIIPFAISISPLIYISELTIYDFKRLIMSETATVICQSCSTINDIKRELCSVCDTELMPVLDTRFFFPLFIAMGCLVAFDYFMIKKQEENINLILDEDNENA